MARRVTHNYGDRIAELVARGEVSLPIPLERPIEPMPVTGEMTASEALEEDRGSYDRDDV